MRRRFLSVIPLILFGLIGQPAYAQGGATLSGRVTAENGGPLPGVSVFIEGMSLGAVTNSDGRYTFDVPGARVNARPVTLTARRLGYRAQSVSVTLSSGAVSRDFVLGSNPLNLGEVVVTGAGTTTSVEKLGSVRNSVDSTLIRRSNETNVVNALAGKAPNVEVSSASGEAGASSFIRI
ncbi:MAG: carboxypeptidase-like regulatory domain-containing protein, partial [Gemmatimonadaceae bacterium]